MEMCQNWWSCGGVAPPVQDTFVKPSTSISTLGKVAITFLFNRPHVGLGCFVMPRLNVVLILVNFQLHFQNATPSHDLSLVGVAKSDRQGAIKQPLRILQNHLQLFFCLFLGSQRLYHLQVMSLLSCRI